jgi:flagellar motility protein MotE (MotC chaperone)
MAAQTTTPRLRGKILAGAGCLAALASAFAVGPAFTAANEPAPPAEAQEVERFCSNIADAARDHRYALQRQELEALKGEVDARVKQLEEKRAEYESWMKQRQEFMDAAEANVVKIYARMRPDAAAERLEEMQAELAAAILMKLEVKQSGLIMNEMERKTAAALTGIMASVARVKDPS